MSDTKTVNVLAVMDAVTQVCHGDDEGDFSMGDVYDARAAIAELIEADKAYDAARRALAETDPQSEDAETMEAMRAHRNHCTARRAAALRVAGGAK